MTHPATAPTAETPRLWLPAFAARAAKGEELADAFLCAMATEHEVKAGETEGTLEVVMTSETPDRDKDVILQAGLDFSHYRRNPVVLWAHDHRTPSIARSAEITTDGKRTLSRDVFDMDDALAVSIYRKVVGGFLRGVSIGGWPTNWSRNEKRGGLDVIELDVWEHSFCNVPAHPDALARAVAAEGHPLDDDPVFQWAVQLLASGRGEGLWLAKATAEALVSGLKLTRGLALFELPAAEIPAALEASAAGDDTDGAPEGDDAETDKATAGDEGGGEGAGEGGDTTAAAASEEPSAPAPDLSAQVAALTAAVATLTARLEPAATGSTDDTTTDKSTATTEPPLPTKEEVDAWVKAEVDSWVLATFGKAPD